MDRYAQSKIASMKTTKVKITQLHQVSKTISSYICCLWGSLRYSRKGGWAKEN